jgi:hypothetical protein
MLSRQWRPNEISSLEQFHATQYAGSCSNASSLCKRRQCARHSRLYRPSPSHELQTASLWYDPANAELAGLFNRLLSSHSSAATNIFRAANPQPLKHLRAGCHGQRESPHASQSAQLDCKARTSPDADGAQRVSNGLCLPSGH